MLRYAKGFIRNKSGTAQALISGLDPGIAYLWKAWLRGRSPPGHPEVYQVAKLHGSSNGLVVNGEDQGETSASKSYEATASGKTVADDAGKCGP